MEEGAFLDFLSCEMLDGEQRGRGGNVLGGKRESFLCSGLLAEEAGPEGGWGAILGGGELKYLTVGRGRMS